jgi:hypothetical protein
MSYEKQNFVDGNVLYAANLNKIEDELITKSSVYIQAVEPMDAGNGDLWVTSVDDNIIDEPEVEEEVKSVQSDWNENNSEAPAFIKNRPFYEMNDNTVKKLDAKFMPIHVSNSEPSGAKEGDLWIDTDESLENNDENETVIITGDWNQNNVNALDYIHNRTHWEELDGEEINWNGNLTGATTVMLADGTHMVRISDSTPTAVKFTANGSRFTDAAGNHIAIGAATEASGGYFVGNKAVVVLNMPCIINDVSYPETGIYVSYVNEDNYVKSVRYGETIVHKIDPKFLPETSENSAEVFVQSNKPVNAAVGDIWIDTTAEGDGIPDVIYLASSTPGSTKVFALRIYDDGELSIVEEGGTN